MKFRALILATALAAPSLFAADAFTIDGRHSEATFRVRHYMSRVSGKFADISGTVNIDRANPSASTVDFAINAASIDTGVADRDKHLRSADFFEVDKYPQITFKSTKIAPSGKKDVYNVSGDFTMHGVTKQVTFPVTVLGFQTMKQGERAGFSLDTTINRKDYNIVWNRALDNGGVMLGDDVDVSVNIEAVKRNEPPAPAAAPATPKQ